MSNVPPISKPVTTRPESGNPGTGASAGSNQQSPLSTSGDRPPLSRYALFFLLLGVGLATDLWTKSYVFANCFDAASYGHYQQEVHWWIDGIFGIQTSTNPGALFGMGKGLSWLFAILSIVALSGIMAWLFIWRAARDRWVTFALGLISGGILGNLNDRLGFGYDSSFPESIRTHVRDWIYFRLDGVPGFDPWPNFNIADSLLVIGAIMLVLHAFFAPVENDTDAGNV